MSKCRGLGSLRLPDGAVAHPLCGSSVVLRLPVSGLWLRCLQRWWVEQLIGQDAQLFGQSLEFQFGECDVATLGSAQSAALYFGASTKLIEGKS